LFEDELNFPQIDGHFKKYTIQLSWKECPMRKRKAFRRRHLPGNLSLKQCDIKYHTISRGIISLTRKAFHIMIVPRKVNCYQKNIKFHDAGRMIWLNISKE